MITMTYTNTFRGQQVTEKVMVPSSSIGRELIAVWNGTEPANATFHYEVVNFHRSTPEDEATLGSFDSDRRYHLSQPKQAFYDRVFG